MCFLLAYSSCACDHVSAFHLVAVEVRDATVVKLFHVCCDWGEFAFVCWQAVFRLPPLHLIKEDTFNSSLIFKILLVVGLIAVFVHTLRSHVQLVGLLLEQILLVLYFILDIWVIMLLWSDLTYEWLITVVQSRLINWRAWLLLLLPSPWTIHNSSSTWSHEATKVHPLVPINPIITWTFFREISRKITRLIKLSRRIPDCIVIKIQLVEFILWGVLNHLLHRLRHVFLLLQRIKPFLRFATLLDVFGVNEQLMGSTKCSLGSWRRLWRFVVPRVLLIDIVKENLAWPNVAFVPGLDWLVHVHETLSVNGRTVLLMTTKRTLRRLFWQQRVLVRISLDIVLHFAYDCFVTFLLDRWFRRQNIVDHVRRVEPRVLHEVIVLLIVKALLAEAVAVELMLGISGSKLEAVARVHELVWENCALAFLDSRVELRPWLVVCGPLERLGALVQRRIVERGAAHVFGGRSELLLNSYLCWQLHSKEWHLSRLFNWGGVKNGRIWVYEIITCSEF